MKFETYTLIMSGCALLISLWSAFIAAMTRATVLRKLRELLPTTNPFNQNYAPPQRDDVRLMTDDEYADWKKRHGFEP